MEFEFARPSPFENECTMRIFSLQLILGQSMAPLGDVFFSVLSCRLRFIFLRNAQGLTCSLMVTFLK